MSNATHPLDRQKTLQILNDDKALRQRNEATLIQQRTHTILYDKLNLHTYVEWNNRSRNLGTALARNPVSDTVTWCRKTQIVIKQVIQVESTN